MSVTLISVSHDTVVSNKHEEQTRHYYVNFQQYALAQCALGQDEPSNPTIHCLYSCPGMSFYLGERKTDCPLSYTLRFQAMALGDWMMTCSTSLPFTTQSWIGLK